MEQKFIPTSQALLDEIERHLRASGMTPTTFGEKAAKDRCFVFDLRKGKRNPGSAKVDDVRQWIADNPPPADTDTPPVPAAFATDGASGVVTAPAGGSA